MNVLIIGGTSDLGIEVIKYFKKLNYNVIVGYNKRIPDIDGITLIKCDVCIEEDIENIISKSILEFGRIDILVNMQSISMDNNFLNKTKNEFMKVLEVNLVGTFLSSQIYSRYIDDGLIINFGSTDGIDTYSEYSIDYSASKAGIINMSKSISLGTKNRVKCICPNWIDSESTRLMNQEYLKSELLRIKQSRLITMDEFISGFDEIINSSFGIVYKMDIKDDKLWIEKC